MRVTKLTTIEPVYPVNKEAVKSHLSITHDEHDEMLRGIITAATEWAEQHCNRAIVRGAYLIAAERFPYGVQPVQLPLGVIESVDSVQYKDSDGNLQAWSSAEYESSLNTYYAPALRPLTGYSWPSVGTYFDAVQITVTAGWDTDDVPYAVQQAILMKCGALYYSRVPGDEDPAPIGKAAEMMLATWRLPPW